MNKIVTSILILLFFTLIQSQYRTQIFNMGTIINGTTTLIFENGFEEGNFSAWTQQYASPGQSFLCVAGIGEATMPHHGNFLAKATINGSLMPTSAYAYKNLPPNYSVINLRFYVYLAEYYAPTQPHETYLGTIASGDLILAQIGLTDVTGEFVFLAYHSKGTVILYSSKTLQLNRWVCIEIQRVQHPEKGEYHVWLDGVELEEFALTELDTSGYVADRIYIGNYHGCAYHKPNHVTFYVDCVAVSNAHIGRE